MKDKKLVLIKSALLCFADDIDGIIPINDLKLLLDSLSIDRATHYQISRDYHDIYIDTYEERVLTDDELEKQKQGRIKELKDNLAEIEVRKQTYTKALKDLTE